MSELRRRDVVRLGALLALVPACKRNAVFSCLDETGLSSEESLARKIVEYSDVSTQAGKECINCSQYVKPPGDGCGGCKLVKGPVHPHGYCKIWAPIA